MRAEGWGALRTDDTFRAEAQGVCERRDSYPCMSTFSEVRAAQGSSGGGSWLGP